MSEEFKPTTEQLAARFIELRDELTQLKATYDADAEVLKEMQAAINEEMHIRLNEAGATSLKTKAGTITRKNTTKYVMRDSGELLAFIRRTGKVELLQARLSTTAVQEMLNNEEPLPAGVGIEQELSIVVRRV
jgi:hypothetical protein